MLALQLQIIKLHYTDIFFFFSVAYNNLYSLEIMKKIICNMLSGLSASNSVLEIPASCFAFIYL